MFLHVGLYNFFKENLVILSYKNIGAFQVNFIGIISKKQSLNSECCADYNFKIKLVKNVPIKKSNENYNVKQIIGTKVFQQEKKTIYKYEM